MTEPAAGVVPKLMLDAAMVEPFNRLAIVEDADGMRGVDVVAGVETVQGARGADRVDNSSRLEGWVEAGSSVSRSIRFPLVPKFRVSLSPPTETKVALYLSGISLPGLSPEDMFGFFRGLTTVSIGVDNSFVFASALLSSSAFAFNKLFL